MSPLKRFGCSSKDALVLLTRRRFARTEPSAVAAAFRGSGGVWAARRVSLATAVLAARHGCLRQALSVSGEAGPVPGACAGAV